MGSTSGGGVQQRLHEGVKTGLKDGQRYEMRDRRSGNSEDEEGGSGVCSGNSKTSDLPGVCTGSSGAV